MLTEGLKNYQITRTALLPAATICYWKINALPAGNRPEFTVGLNSYVWFQKGTSPQQESIQNNKFDFSPKLPLYYIHFEITQFGMIWIRIRISDPRSVWIIVHQRNWWIHSGHGFIGSFDVPWSRQILDHWSWSDHPKGTHPKTLYRELSLKHKSLNQN